MDYSPPAFSVHGILHTRILEWVPLPFSKGSFWPRIEPGSLALQADSLPPEAPGSPLYTVLYVKYTKAQQLIEDAHMWQPTPDMWTNSRDWTCEPMFQSLKFTIWRFICRGLTVCTVGYLWTCTVQICIFQGSFFGFEFVWKPSLYFCILTIYTSLLWELLTIFTLNFSLLLALHCDDLKLLGSLCTSYPKKAIVDFYCASI